MPLYLPSLLAPPPPHRVPGRDGHCVDALYRTFGSRTPPPHCRYRFERYLHARFGWTYTPPHTAYPLAVTQLPRRFHTLHRFGFPTPPQATTHLPAGLPMPHPTLTHACPLPVIISDQFPTGGHPSLPDVTPALLPDAGTLPHPHFPPPRYYHAPLNGLFVLRALVNRGHAIPPPPLPHPGCARSEGRSPTLPPGLTPFRLVGRFDPSYLPPHLCWFWRPGCIPHGSPNAALAPFPRLALLRLLAVRGFVPLPHTCRCGSRPTRTRFYLRFSRHCPCGVLLHTTQFVAHTLRRCRLPYMRYPTYHTHIYYSTLTYDATHLLPITIPHHLPDSRTLYRLPLHTLLTCTHGSHTFHRYAHFACLPRVTPVCGLRTTPATYPAACRVSALTLRQ